ncbi:MAG TPA: hypothetical protein DDW27_16890 [Bacteroidales bacterium]|nr:hypothetical protein [Bacteroidales bacterium]
MNNEEHPDISELINYSKGIYSDTGSGKENYNRIVRHLANCTECLSLLQDIHNLKEDFDEIWDNLFPLPEAEIVEQPSSAVANILKWIGSARIRKELAEVLGEVENLVREGISQIIDYKITTQVTTLGTGIEGQATLYFSDSQDVSMFDSIVMKDNDLIFHAGSDPGYKNICIVGPGQMHRIARIIKYGKGQYIAKFSDITVKPEGCFVHLY